MTPLFAQRRSSERSFERLYRAHVQDVYRYALMLLRNKADAEDAAQTTFMKAYRAVQRGEQPRHPRQWLITIAHNTCRTKLRDSRRRPQEVGFDEQIAEASQIRGGAEEIDVAELVQALGALSFNQRSALVMRELEGRSYAEIAGVLDVSTSAVETLLFRARRALREQLEGPLTCGEVERALSLQLDGRLASEERGRLRAHLRECGECASLARRQRARRAALRSLGPLPLPGSLASWGGGAAATSGIAAKAAAILAAGVVAAGSSHEPAQAVDEPTAAPKRPAAGRPLVDRTIHARAGAPVAVRSRQATTPPAETPSPNVRARWTKRRPSTLPPLPETPAAAPAPAVLAPTLPISAPALPTPALPPVQVPSPPPVPALPSPPVALPVEVPSPTGALPLEALP